MEQIIEIIFKFINAAFIKIFRGKEKPIEEVFEEEKTTLQRNYNIYIIITIAVLVIYYLIK